MAFLKLLLLCVALPQVQSTLLRGEQVRRHQPVAKALLPAHRGLALATVAHGDGRALQATPPVTNCTERPAYCGAPLHCEVPPTEDEMLGWVIQFAQPEQPNLKSWCGQYAFASGVVEQCLKNRDLALAGKLTFEAQKATNTDELDASYCFIAGHCDPDGPAVANNATVEDGVKLCDAKFGPAGWTTAFGAGGLFVKMNTSAQLVSHTCGFLSRDLAMDFGKLACAMGNWHCDVIYCRESYCNNPYYAGRYKRYLDPSVTPSCPT